jgi:hypothetical protein
LAPADGLLPTPCSHTLPTHPAPPPPPPPPSPTYSHVFEVIEDDEQPQRAPNGLGAQIKNVEDMLDELKRSRGLS